MYSVALKSIACELPKTDVLNDDACFSKIDELPKHWFKFWGIKKRGFFDESLDENELTAGCKASIRALHGAKVSSSEVDMVIATSSFAYLHGSTGNGKLDAKRFAPRLAEAIKQELCLDNAKTIDQQADCLSFIVGMQIAAGLIKQGIIKNALICCSEFLSPGMDTTRKESTIFGDGCGAAVLSRSKDNGNLIGSLIKSDASHYMVATARWRQASKPESVSYGKEIRPYFTLKSDGQETMKKFIPYVVPEMVNGVLENLSLAADDIDFFIFHQPSKVLVDAWGYGSGAQADKYIYTMDEQGVMVSVSIPFTLYQALKQKKIKGNEKVVIAGAATGWSFGAQVWQLENTVAC